MSNDTENNKFDELFRNRFEEGKLPVSDNLLSNIKNELGLEEKKKRRFFFWWWFGGFCAVAFVIGAVYYFNKYESKANYANVVDNNDTTETTKRITNIETIENVSEPTANEKRIDAAVPLVNEAERTEGNQQAETTVAANTTHNNVATEPGTKKKAATVKNTATVVANTTIAEDKANENLAKTSVSMSVEKAQAAANKTTKNKKENSLKALSVNTLDNESKNLENKKTTTNVDKNNNVTASNNIANESDKKNVVAANNTETTTAITTTANQKQNVEIKSENKKINTNDAAETVVAKDSTAIQKTTTSPSVAKTDSTLSKKDTLVKAVTKPKADSIVQQNNLNKPEIAKNRLLYVEANGGFSQSFRSLDNNSAVDRTGDKPWLTYNAGIDVGVLFKNKYQISVGLGIDNKGEKYNFKGKDAVYDTQINETYGIDSIPIFDSTQQIIGWEYDSTLVYDTNTVLEQPAIAAKSVINKYQYVKLPIMFGYRFGITDKFFVTPNVGAVVNFLVSAQATWYDPELQQYIVFDTRDKYRTIVWVARAKIDIGYMLNEKWSILLQPAYTRYLNGIYRSEAYFKETPYSYDVNLGIRYTF